MSHIASLIEQCRKSGENTVWLNRALEKLLQTSVSFKTSHGTLYRAYPYKVECSGSKNDIASSTRVWIKFHSLGNPERTSLYEEHTDVVSLSSIQDPFALNVRYPSQFAVEVGSKLLPIQIFHIHQERGKTVVLFIKLDSMARLVQAARNQIVSMQIYSCSPDVLHCIQGRDAKDTENRIHRLIAEYRDLRDRSTLKIPGFLKLRKISVSATTSHKEALNALANTISKKVDFSRSLSQAIDTETELDIFRFMRGI